MSKPTRFAKIDLHSLSRINLSAHNLSKPKPHTRASHKVIDNMQFRFGGITHA